MQCKFNDAALEDIERITEYGYDKFGEKSTRQYAEGLKQKCHAIADAPLQHQAVDDLRRGYRRGVYKTHAIYFCVTDKAVEIMRILHSEDTKKTAKRVAMDAKTDDPDLQASLKLGYDVLEVFEDVVTKHRTLRERLFAASVALDQGKRTSVGEAFESVYREHHALTERLEKRCR